ncbi:hypothetical protein ACQPXH_21400 [Nocardia sp. CA-135953]|uniref:hypothetical protein n=1 Tax=Nocardia sp. CA-135953 TaxID=3239978 RepID=UPI003D9790BA
MAALPPLPDVGLVGLGYSLGGQITVTAQARHRPFDRIVVLGSSFVGNSELGAKSLEDAAAALKAMSLETWDSGYLEVPRELLGPQFHADDVPDAVLRAEEARCTVLPREAGMSAPAIFSGIGSWIGRRTAEPGFVSPILDNRLDVS